MLYLIKKDLKDILGYKKRIILTMVVLIIIIISTSLYVSKQEILTYKKLSLGVINEDTSPYSKLLLEYFKTSESFSSYISVYEGEQTEIKNEFKKGFLDVYLMIPKGFSDNLIRLNHLPVEVVIRGEDRTKAILMDNILKSYEKYIKAIEISCVALYDRMEHTGFHTEFINKKNIEISYDLIFMALGKEFFFEYEEIGDYKNTPFLKYMAVAFLCTITLYFIFYMGLFIRIDRETGIYGRLYGAGVPIYLYLLEKLIVLYSVIGIPIILFILIINLFFGMSISFLSVLLYMIILFTGVNLIIFVNGLFNKTSEYLLAGNFYCLFSAIFGGGIIPIMFLPDPILKLSYLTPTYWMIRSVINMESSKYLSTCSKILPIMLLTGIVFYLLSIFLYKKEGVVRG